MRVSMGSIVGMVCSQQNSNMQKHMSGYDNSGEDSYKVPSKEELQKQEAAKEIASLIRYIGFFVYGDNSRYYRF